jgi:hypothetical protein
LGIIPIIQQKTLIKGKNMNNEFTYTLTLTPNEAQAIVNIIGSLKTETGVFPLYNIVLEQLKAQMPEQPETEQTV